LFHLHRQVGVETSALKIQTPGNYPEESIKHSEHGESLKSRMLASYFHKIFPGFLDTAALEDETYTMFRKVGHNIPSFAAPHPRRKETSIFVGIFFPTQTWQRPVTTCICKPEAANTV